MGIYVGNGWFVHSSSHGVTLDPMTGWYADQLRVGADDRSPRPGSRKRTPPSAGVRAVGVRTACRRLRTAR